MSNQTQIAAVDSPKRRGRGRFRWLGGAVVLVLGLILAGTIYESVSEAADIRAYPPPGQMVDVGGYRLHINCTGTGSPTVVIDAGWGDWSALVGLGSAGSGKDHTASAPMIEPVWGRARLAHCHGTPSNSPKNCIPCLQQANIARPLCAGRPLAGRFTVRVFAHDYPTEVAGVVLIDSMSPGQMTQPPTEIKPQTPSQSSGVSLPSLLARIGLVRC